MNGRLSAAVMTLALLSIASSLTAQSEQESKNEAYIVLSEGVEQLEKDLENGTSYKLRKVVKNEMDSAFSGSVSGQEVTQETSIDPQFLLAKTKIRTVSEKNVDQSLLAQSINILGKKGEAFFVKRNDGNWRRFEDLDGMPDSVGDLLDTTKNEDPEPSKVLSFLSDASIVGENEIDGVPCHKIDGKIDREKAEGFIDQRLEKLNVVVERADVKMTGVSFWVAKEAEQLIRQKMTFKTTVSFGGNQGEEEQEMQMNVTEKTTFSDIGQAEVQQKYRDKYRELQEQHQK